MEQSPSDCALTPSIQEDTTLCSERPTVQLTAKQRKAHQRFGIDIKATTGLDLLPAPSNNGRLTSQCATCLKANNKTFKRNAKEKWVDHAKICPGLILLRLVRNVRQREDKGREREREDEGSSSKNKKLELEEIDGKKREKDKKESKQSQKILGSKDRWKI
jgi:hypothetical protein